MLFFTLSYFDTHQIEFPYGACQIPTQLEHYSMITVQRHPDKRKIDGFKTTEIFSFQQISTSLNKEECHTT